MNSSKTNIISINEHRNHERKSTVTKALFSRLDFSLKSAGANLEKSFRIAKTLAPILQDQSSNHHHLTTLSSDAPAQEKVIAILMLGFPKNQQVLPTLQTILLNGPESLRIASAIAISQMRTKDNTEVLSDILLEGYQSTASEKVKHAIRQAALSLLDKKSAKLVKVLLSQTR